MNCAQETMHHSPYVFGENLRRARDSHVEPLVSEKPLMRRYYRHVPLFLLQLELMERLVEVQLSRVPHALDCFILTPVVHRDP